jgi:aminoglycoside phosphotransferase (APT) family kinase protein
VEIGASAEPDDFPTDDIVHWDLHNENVLALDGRVTAVVDSEYALVGDAGFDLVTLALCTLGADPGPGSVGAHLWGRVADEVDARLAPAYVAHILLRAVDWEIRNHEAAELDLWLAEAERRLPPG